MDQFIATKKNIILIIALILLTTFFLAFDNEKEVSRRHTQTYPVYLNIGLTLNHLNLVGR